MQEAAKTAISVARQQNMYLVIDADGLWLIQNEPEVVKGYRKAVLTPNVVEFGRLCEKLVRRNSPLLRRTRGSTRSRTGHR